MSELIERIASLPFWQGRPTIAPMAGGMSNFSFVAVDERGKYAVRVGEDYPFHRVARDRELAATRAAFAAGFGPEVLHEQQGIAILQFIEGRVFTEADVRANVARVGSLIRRFHDEMSADSSDTAYVFEAFKSIRDYAETLRSSSNPLARERLAGLPEITEELAAAQLPLPTTFGHNDLMPGNIIDDGERLWLIDFEYAGSSTAMFDLGNLSSNAGFGETESDALLAAYLGREPSADWRMALAAMQCASLLREALWSLVSELYLDAPGADYDRYAKQNFARFDAALAAYRARFGRR